MKTTRVIDSHDQFYKQYQVFTNNILDGLNWENIFLAGGSVLSCITKPDEDAESAKKFNHHRIMNRTSDLDLFIYGANQETAENVIKHIYNTIANNVKTHVLVARSQLSITLMANGYRMVQIILRLYKSIPEILMGFDIDCCCGMLLKYFSY